MIKVLFVYRAYGDRKINSVVDYQMASIVVAGISIQTFHISAGGLKSYIRSITELKKFINGNSIDLIHAHYSFSGFVGALATNKPVVCSLMGSDILKMKRPIRFITWIFYKLRWKATIVKSKEMQRAFPKALLLANGVDLSNFRIIKKEEAILKTHFKPEDINIIFVAENPNSKVKNLRLAEVAVSLMDKPNIKLHPISGKTFEELPFYYNSADALLLTSLSEGSPNVIKEAMACNCPIVATDVGDIKEVIQNTKGCYVTDFNPQNIALSMDRALSVGRTDGRKNIEKLSTSIVAEKIVDVYRRAMQ